MQACLTISYNFRQENQKSRMSNFQRLFTHKHELQMIENGLQFIYQNEWNGREWGEKEIESITRFVHHVI